MLQPKNICLSIALPLNRLLYLSERNIIHNLSELNRILQIEQNNVGMFMFAM